MWIKKYHDWFVVDEGWIVWRVCTFSTAASSPLPSGRTSLGPNLIYSSVKRFSVFILCWPAWAPLSTSERQGQGCCRLKGELWTAAWRFHSRLGRCVRSVHCGRCGSRRRLPPWSCGTLGCRSSCSWCCAASSCARPGNLRCTPWWGPLWQG